MTKRIRDYLLIWLAAMAMAFLFSIDDFAWPKEYEWLKECEELFTIVHDEVDPDGNTYWSIRVTTYMQENGTDANCERFGRCVYDLIGSAHGMGAVEIINPASEWVPSIWRWIESTRARTLAGIDGEEWAIADTMSWHWVEYDD